MRNPNLRKSILLIFPIRRKNDVQRKEITFDCWLNYDFKVDLMEL